MSRALTIVFITNNYTPYSGGVVSSIQAFTQQLRALGHRVYIITLDFEGAVPEPWVIRVPCPIKFIYKNNPMAVPWCMRQELEALLARLAPDIVHSHHPFLLGMAALKTCKKLGIPLVFTFHTHYEKFSHYVPFPDVIVRPVINYQVARYCALVDLVLAPSLSVHQWLHTHGVECAVHALPSPVLPIFSEQHFMYKTVGEPRSLLFVGRFTQEKNIPALLDSLVPLLVSGTRLTLAGFGYQEHTLRNYVYHSLGLSSEQVKFVVRPSKTDLCFLYKRADLFVFCSQTETQGLVMLEAMSAGTPVIALKGPGLEDYVINGVNGFLVNTPEQIGSAVQTVLADSELFKKLQSGAWLTAQQYTVQMLTVRLLSCYNQYLTNP